MSMDENIQLEGCRITNLASSQTNKNIKLSKDEEIIIECKAKIAEPPIAAKYRVQVEVTYNYVFSKDINIPVKYNTISGEALGDIISISTPYSQNAGLLDTLVDKGIESAAIQIIPGVVSDTVRVSSPDLSNSLQQYIKMQFGPQSGREEADNIIRTDSTYISNKIFLDGKLTSEEGTCKGKEVIEELKRDQTTNICSPQNIAYALSGTGCDKIIIDNGDRYWSKKIDEKFAQDKQEIIEGIQSGVKEGILTNENVIVSQYRDKILDDLRVKMGRNMYLNINLNGLVDVIADRFIGQLTNTITQEPTQQAYVNYHAAFKQGFLQEYNSKIIQSVSEKASNLCQNNQGVFKNM